MVIPLAHSPSTGITSIWGSCHHLRVSPITKDCLSRSNLGDRMNWQPSESNHHFLQFYPNKGTLFPSLTLLPQVVSEFHMLKHIVLPTFFCHPPMSWSAQCIFWMFTKPWHFISHAHFSGNLTDCSSALLAPPEAPDFLPRQSLNGSYLPYDWCMNWHICPCWILSGTLHQSCGHFHSLP